MKLENETVLITGATSGIGRAVAGLLCERGNTIIAVGRDRNKLADITKQAGVALSFDCDLTSKAELTKLHREIHLSGHQVSVLVNNAAVQHCPKFNDVDFDFDSIEPEITTNFTAVAMLSALLLPMLKAAPQGGRIVNMSSGLAMYPKSDAAVYCATKAAVRNLSQALRYQLAPDGIRVHEVILPLVDTPMTAGRGARKLRPEQAAKATIEGIERGRDEIFVGKARMLPVLNRISPALTRCLMQRL